MPKPQWFRVFIQGATPTGNPSMHSVPVRALDEAQALAAVEERFRRTFPRVKIAGGSVGLMPADWTPPKSALIVA